MHVVGLLFIAIIAGIAAVVALWSYGPVLTILCAPFVASSVTVVCAVLATVRRPGGTTFRSAYPHMIEAQQSGKPVQFGDRTG